MEAVETGQEKVKKICEALQRETIDPAKKEAAEILHKAREDATHLIEEAKVEVQELHRQAKERIIEERNIFEASIHLACKKSLSVLKQKIEKNLFNETLERELHRFARDPEVIAKIIAAVISGIEKQGIDTNLRAIIPAEIEASVVNAYLGGKILERLEKESVELGDLRGGAQVKLVDKKMTIEITEETLMDLVSSYIQDEFRSLIFQG